MIKIYWIRVICQLNRGEITCEGFIDSPRVTNQNLSAKNYKNTVNVAVIL